MGSLVQRESSTGGVALEAYVCLPSVLGRDPRGVRWQPVRQGVVCARRLVNQIRSMMTQTKRARIQKLVDGCERSHSHQHISFDFGKVWSTAENDAPLDLAEMKWSLVRVS